MPERIINIVLISFLLVPLLSIQLSAATCPCGFDTTKYSAVAEGEGYCGSVTKEGKHCAITFNGNVKSLAGIEPSSIYGSLERYLLQIREINIELSRTQYLVAARDPNWLIRNLSLLVRSAYVTAPFLSYQEREKLDNVLNIFFRNYGRDVYKAITASRAPFVKENFEVSRGKIDFKVENISIVFVMSIPEKF